MSQQELHELIIYQDRYFEILTEFFLSVTGCPPRDFSALDSFPESIQGMAATLRENPSKAEKSMLAYSTLEKELKKLYSEEGGKAFRVVFINLCHFLRLATRGDDSCQKKTFNST